MNRAYFDSLSRRETLTLGLGVVALTYTPAWSQATNSYQQFSPLFTEAIGIRSFAIENTFPINSTKFLDLEFFARRNALVVANKSEVFKSSESAKEYVRNIPSILPANFPVAYDKDRIETQIAVIDLIVEKSLPIAPSPSSITPAEIPSLPPAKANKDSDLVVVVDIFLETIGLSVGVRSIVLSAIESDTRLKGYFDMLLGSITTKNWNEVINIGEKIFQLFMGANILSKMPEVFTVRFSFRLGLRAVPIVGWFYLGACFVVALKSNYHRFSFA